MIDHWEVLALRQKGATYDAVAATLRISRTGVRDAIRRAEKALARGEKPGPIAFTQKVTPEMVRAIRERRGGVRGYGQKAPKGSTYWELARDFKLSPSYVAKICLGYVGGEVAP